LLKILSIILLCSGNAFPNDIIKADFKAEWLQIITAEEPPNDSLVLLELEKHKIPFIKDFLLQIKKESGNYKSKLSLEYHNITGMKQPRQRQTLAIGTNKYFHASFNNWRECIADLKMFIDYSPPKINETFLQFMKRRGYNYTFNKKN